MDENSTYVGIDKDLTRTTLVAMIILRVVEEMCWTQFLLSAKCWVDDSEN